jgi:hypothetical protein
MKRRTLKNMRRQDNEKAPKFSKIKNDNIEMNREHSFMKFKFY